MSIPDKFLPDKINGRTCYYGTEVYSRENKYYYRGFSYSSTGMWQVFNLSQLWAAENVGYARKVRGIRLKLSVGSIFAGSAGTNMGYYAYVVQLFVGPNTLSSAMISSLPGRTVLDYVPLINPMKAVANYVNNQDLELVYPFEITMNSSEQLFVAIQYVRVQGISTVHTCVVDISGQYDIKFLGI